MGSTSVIVRPLAESDLTEWLRLRKLLWDQTPEDEHKEEMLDIIEHGETQQVFVAESGDKLVGFLEASIRPFVEGCETENVGYLEGWYVERERRREGIGSAMVSAAEDWARERGCAEMASDAEVGNELSLSAHTSLGYKESARLVHLQKVL